MEVIVAPNRLNWERTSVFLAGGISNCPDWQADALDDLADLDINVFNPRRSGVLAPEWAEEQIRWEHAALHSSDIIMFWFPSETLCPITLFELGAHAKRDVRLVVGTHPEYARRLDVVIQMELERPELRVHSTLRGVTDELREILAH